MAERSHPDTNPDVSERSENRPSESVSETDPETGGYAKENGINIICRRAGTRIYSNTTEWSNRLGLLKTKTNS